MFFAIAFHHTNEWESENKNTKYKTLLIQNIKTLIQHLIYVNINNVNLQLTIIISSIQLINFHFFAPPTVPLFAPFLFFYPVIM